MNNKFTIIIPTRERCETLYYTIKTCLNQTYENYEILVSDNYSQDNTRNIVDSFIDEKIRYVNTGKRCSMSENFDFALSHVHDGFLMFIGDDDGILPNSLEYVNHIINETSCEAVVSHNAFYLWPDSNENPNRLFWNSRSGYEVRNSKEWIEKYLKFRMPYTFDLPGVYCGFVHRKVLSRVTKGPNFFRSPTPDAYSALAVAFATDEYVYSHTAFVVHGSSSRSNGASFLSKAKGEEGQESKKFMKENTISFHKDIVFTKAFRVSSLESYLQFSDAFPSLTKDYKIDWSLFLKYVLSESTNNTKRELEDAVQQMCNMHDVSFEEIVNYRISKFTDLSLLEIIKKIFFKVMRVFSHKENKLLNVKKIGVNNIYDAVLLLKFILLKEFDFK